MIDVREGKIPVQRSVDRRSTRIEIEGAVRQVAHHFIFVLDTAVELLEPQQRMQVQRGEAVELHRPDIPARSLYPEHSGLFPGERVAFLELGGGVTPTEVGDSEI